MARAFWKGAVSFGLVEIPISLRPAVSSDDLHFSLLDREDFAPVGYRRYNKSTGKEVPWDRVVRGYEYEPDEYVVLSDEELRAANVKASQTIEILEFVDGGEIDPVYFDVPYYVEPSRKESRSYALLRETMARTGKVAIARLVLRTRQHLAALHVRDHVLVLNLLHYAHELVPSEEARVPAIAVKPTDREVRMAERLVEGMTGRWNPDQYRDEYRDDVMALVERKVKAGKTHTIVEPREGGDATRAKRDVMDLMPLLQKSLESRKEKAAPARSTSRSPKPAAAERRRASERSAPQPARSRSRSRTQRKSA